MIESPSPLAPVRNEPARISFVIPVMNEMEVIAELRSRLEKLATQLPGEVEWIFIDDGSSDGTTEYLFAWAKNDARVKVLRFSRNFGHQAAITAGLDHADGDVVIVMDADLQDPPELAIPMIAKYRAGYDVVYAQRMRRHGESFFKRTSAWLFYRIMQRFMSGMPIDTGDFRLMSKAVVVALRTMREGHRFLRGMITWLGFQQASVPFERPPRFGGETKYPVWKLVRLALDGIVSFSTTPLRAGIYLGGLLFLSSLVYVAVAVIRKLNGDSLPWGWTSLITLQCLIGGAILISLGIIGEYVGRIYEENKARPMYIVSDLANLAPATLPEKAVVPLTTALPPDDSKLRRQA